ncbi:MAG: MFS transporter, partial [Beijerinckiaceae bacterium]
MSIDRDSFFANPTRFLMAINFVNFVGFASWSALINNFAVESAGFTFRDNGIMQSVREIPGLLAFTAIFWLLLMREQLFAYFAMLALALGVFLTGYFPSFWGIIITTYVMSVGFHYMETAQQSLALQLLPKATAAIEMGKVSGAGAAAQFVAYSGVALMAWLGISNYPAFFAVAGGAALVLGLLVILLFKRMEGPVVQRKG